MKFFFDEFLVTFVFFATTVRDVNALPDIGYTLCIFFTILKAAIVLDMGTT